MNTLHYESKIREPAPARSQAAVISIAEWNATRGRSPNHSNGEERIRRLPRPVLVRYSFSKLMYENFTAQDRWTKKEVHCLYQALIVAISTRHADAIDI